MSHFWALWGLPESLLGHFNFGIVQTVFSEKASAIARMRQKCVRNASEMRQNGSCFIGKRGTFQNASEMRQICVKNARNTFGGEHLLEDTDNSFCASVELGGRPLHNSCATCRAQEACCSLIGLILRRLGAPDSENGKRPRNRGFKKSAEISHESSAPL